VLTPVPTEPPVGLVTGTPLLVGGADLCDSLATLVAYRSGKSAHEVLVATVDEPAEAKLLEALALSETKMVPVEMETEVHGRLPADIEHQLYEQLQKVAISVNHHLKVGDGIPQHTHENFEKAMAAISALGPELEAQGDKEMLAHYAAAGEAIAELAAWIRQGGRIDDVSQTVHAYPTFAEGPARAADEHVRRRFRSPRYRRLSRVVLATFRRARPLFGGAR
jgi:Asp-tRNA(Asn)/Glu-tRNA(Gln) amidotransferase A subunit family amidase